ncbi:MAG: ATP-binding protein, partial [Gemmatimonadota bacterium]|nr:ATP-binding protein [Gemmatimonadota bacterium]
IILQIFIFYTVALITSHLNIRLHLTGSLLEDTRRLLSQYRLDTKEILENVSSGLVTCNSSGVIIYANAASGQLLGIPSEELPGRPAGKIFARLCPEIAGIIDSAIQSRRVARRRRVKLSTMEGGREGSVVSLAVSSSVLLEGSGRLRGVSLIFEDITPEVKAQELELRTGKLEAVAELAASLAHEIKNPLASISSAVELMRDDTGASRQTRHRKLVDLILKESGRLTELLKEFLQFASGSFGPSERIVLGPLLTSVIESAKNHPDWRKNVRVRVSPEVSSMNIAGPPSSVSQVFYNLLINAVQAEGPDHRRASSITIESCSDVAGRRQLAAGEELNSRQWLWLRLYDNGPGIDKSLRERIFEPFYTTRKGGFGLGLAVVHRIVNSLGGLIYADSSPEGPGGGAFIIALPMDTGKEAGTAPGGEGKVEIETEKSSIS